MRFGIKDQVSKRRVKQFALLAPLNRFEARYQPCFFRKAAKQRLAEAVDGQYLQPAAGRIQNLCEQLPRFFAGLGACIGTNRLKVMKQKPVVHLHPTRQQLINAVRHFGRTRLGEGDAQ